MRIAVIGSSITEEGFSQKAETIGIWLAKNKHIVLTGGSLGYPHITAMAALKAGGQTVAYAAGKSIDDHMRFYDIDLSGYTKIIFQKNYGGDELSRIDNYLRSFDMVRDADAAIVVSGRVGTMFELTVLCGLGKDVFVLENSGGITGKTIKAFAEEGHKSGSKIKFFGDAEELSKCFGI